MIAEASILPHLCHAAIPGSVCGTLRMASSWRSMFLSSSLWGSIWRLMQLRRALLAAARLRSRSLNARSSRIMMRTTAIAQDMTRNSWGFMCRCRSRPMRMICPRKNDGETELHYNNFSIVMNAKRWLAQVVASNLDASETAKEPEPCFTYSRHRLNGFISKCDREKWFFDPRIPARDQLPDKFYNLDRTAFDKGHLVGASLSLLVLPLKRCKWPMEIVFAPPIARLR